MKTFLIVRHGETWDNLHHIVQGLHPNRGRLTPKGVKQAALLGERLKDTSIDAVFCSPLERAVLTMGEILKARNTKDSLPLFFPPSLKEISLGVLEGQPHEAWQQALEKNPMGFRPRKGESWYDLERRVIPYFQNTLLAQPYKTILVVAHGGVNKVIISHLAGTNIAQAWKPSEEGIPQENTCFNLLEVSAKKQLKKAIINDTTHLENTFPEATPGQEWLGKGKGWKLLGEATPARHFLEKL